VGESPDSKAGYWQDPFWRTWRPLAAGAIGVGIGAGLAEWFQWDRPARYALIVLGILLGYCVFGLWLLVKRR
jgi:hypothetical protein